MRSLQAWFQRQSLPVFFLAVLVLWVGVRLAFLTGRSDAVRVVGDIVGGLLFAAIATGLLAARRRRLGGREQAVEYLGALKSGRLPADADAARWRNALEHDRRVARRSQWSIPILAAIPTLASVLLLALDLDHPLAAVLLIAVFISLGVLGVLSSRRQLGRLDALTAQLDPGVVARPSA